MQEKINFEQIWKRQKDFNEKINGVQKTQKEKELMTKEFVLHLMTEAAEVLENINWKFHRKDVYNKNNPISISNIKEELIDCAKYVFSMAQFWGMDSQEFLKEFERKSIVVEQRYNQEKKLNLIKDKNVICVDIDGVLAKYPTGFVSFIEKEKKIKIPKPQTYNLYDEVGAIIGKDEVKRLKHKFRESGEKRYLPILPGCAKVLQEIKSTGNKIILLSARPVKKYTRIFGDTIEWLKSNKIPYDAIIWDENKEEKILNEFPKIKFMVEDHPGNAQKIAAAGYKVFLMDAPYNQGFLHNNVIRVKTWEDIHKWINLKKE